MRSVLTCEFSRRTGGFKIERSALVYLTNPGEQGGKIERGAFSRRNILFRHLFIFAHLRALHYLISHITIHVSDTELF